MNELVSVIITTYNRGHILINAIESVRTQSYKNIEIIVVDDCSNDTSYDIFNKYISVNNFNNIIYLKNKNNMGANYSRNRGINASKGEYISFLDDDDEYYPTKIEEQLELINKNNNVIVYCGSKIYNKGKLIKQSRLKYNGDIFDKIIEDNFLGNLSLLLIKRSILLKNNLDNDFPACQDWDLLTRLANKYEFYHTNSRLVKINKHEEESIGAGPKAIIGFKMYYNKHIKNYCFSKVLKLIILYFLRAIVNKQLFQIKKILFLLKAYFLNLMAVKLK